MLYSLTEFELLRGTNAVACEHGGRHVGKVGNLYAWSDENGELVVDGTGKTYRNQWNICVELRDDASVFGSEVAPGDHEWIIWSGFCQTQIQRAPSGGFGLEIPKELLALCPTVSYLQDLWNCQLGVSNERDDKLNRWFSSVKAYRREQAPILADMNAFVREAALTHAHRGGLLE